MNVHKVAGLAHTRYPVAEQQTNSILGRKRINEDRAENGDTIRKRPGVCSPVWPIRRGRRRAEDHDDCKEALQYNRTG